MKKRWQLLAVMAGLFVLLVDSAPASAAYGIDEKIALEESISKKILEIAVNMLGTDKLIVLVDIEQATAPEVISEQNPQENPQKNILPGIPPDAVEAQYSYRQDASLLSNFKFPDFVKKVSVLLILNETIQETDIALLQNYLNEYMNLQAERGDSIVFKKMPFAALKPDIIGDIRNASINQAPWVIAVLLFAIFIFGPLRSFMKNIVSAVEVFKIQADTRILTKIESSGVRAADMIKQGVLGSGDTVNQLAASNGTNQPRLEGNQHFTFINSENLKNLMFLIKSEKPETIALVLTYMPSHYSNLILESLAEKTRIEILKIMAETHQYNKAEVESVESHLRERVNYLFGGPQNIADLINSCEPEMREKILSEISDPQLVEEIKKILVLPEDVAKLSKEHLYEIYKSAGGRVFAAALKSMKDDIKAYVLDNLSEGAREMLAQEMDLITNKITPSRIAQARKDLVTVMRNFESQGIIKIPRANN